MKQIWNRNHQSLSKLDSLVPKPSLVLYPMSLTPKSLEWGGIPVTLFEQKL